MTFVRTPEQNEIIETAKTTDGNLIISAYAGAAKTTTLREIAIDMPDTTFLYLAFNKRTQLDAEDSFPPNVTAKTAHSLAYGKMRMFESHWRKKLDERMFAKDYMAILDIPPVLGHVYGTAVFDTVKQFEYSDDEFVNHWHVPFEVKSKMRETIEKQLPYENKEKEFINQLRESHLQKAVNRMAEEAQTLWDMKIDPGSKVPIEHDTYLKLWQLSKPIINNYDVILYDEAQDANPVILDIVLQQKIRQFYVGDKFQQIYRFRGAVDAMSKIKAEDKYLTQSFRFGPAIAQIAAAILKDRKLVKPIRGYDKIDSRVGNVNRKIPYTHIFRTNAGLLREALFLSEGSVKVAVVGDIYNAVDKVNSAYNLYKQKKVTNLEIKQYDTWDELVELSKKNNNYELITITEFILEHGDDIPRLMKQLKESCRYPEESADVILTTAHKAKGREFDQVVLNHDFERRLIKDGEPRYDVSDDEVNLLYVAATRAIRCLEVTGGIMTFINRKIEAE